MSNNCYLLVDNEHTRNESTTNCITPDLLGPQVEMSEITQQPPDLSVNASGQDQVATNSQINTAIEAQNAAQDRQMLIQGGQDVAEGAGDAERAKR